jgi:hypothetical protein
MNRWPFGHVNRNTTGTARVHPINVIAEDLERDLTIVPNARQDTRPMATTAHVCARCQYNTQKQGIHNNIAAAAPEDSRFKSSGSVGRGNPAHRYQSEKGIITSQYQVALGYRSSTRPCPASAAMNSPDRRRCPSYRHHRSNQRQLRFSPNPFITHSRLAEIVVHC